MHLEPSLKGHKVVWHERVKQENDSGRHDISYDGTPFFINGEVILECQHSTDRHESWRKLQKKREEEVCFSAPCLPVEFRSSSSYNILCILTVSA